jgi:hypothetical protein
LLWKIILLALGKRDPTGGWGIDGYILFDFDAKINLVGKVINWMADLTHEFLTKTD